MEETNNESIEKKLAYLNETKGLIKSAIINKGQELTDETPFRDYVQKIDDIETGVDTSDATALASDLLKGKTAYNAEGKIEGTLELKDGDVKLFETQEEMQSDTTVKEGDKAIVYRSEIQNMTADMEVTSITFPETVTLPAAFTDNTYCRLRAVDSSIMFDGNCDLNKTSFRFDGYSDTGMIRVEYTSTDGITYARTRFQGDSGDLTNPVEVPACKVEQQEEWNDNLGYFMQIGGMYFEGLFQYLKVDTNNQLTINPLSLNISDTTINLVQAGPILNYEILKSAAKYLSQFYTDSELQFDAYIDYENKVHIIYAKSGYNSLDRMFIVNKNSPLIYMGTSSSTFAEHFDAIYDDVEKTFKNEQSIAFTTMFKNISSSGFNCIKINGYPICPIGIQQNNYDKWRHFNSAIYYLDTIDSNTNINITDNKLKLNEMVTKYVTAPNQFNLTSSNQLLPKIKAYGKNGVVEGDNSIYDNLDNGIILEKFYKLKKIQDNLYGDTLQYIGNVVDNRLTYLKKDPNGTKMVMKVLDSNISKTYNGAYSGVPLYDLPNDRCTDYKSNSFIIRNKNSIEPLFTAENGSSICKITDNYLYYVTWNANQNSSVKIVKVNLTDYTSTTVYSMAENLTVSDYSVAAVFTPVMSNSKYVVLRYSIASHNVDSNRILLLNTENDTVSDIMPIHSSGYRYFAYIYDNDLIYFIYKTEEASDSKMNMVQVNVQTGEIITLLSNIPSYRGVAYMAAGGTEWGLIYTDNNYMYIGYSNNDVIKLDKHTGSITPMTLNVDIKLPNPHIGFAYNLSRFSNNKSIIPSYNTMGHGIFDTVTIENNNISLTNGKFYAVPYVPVISMDDRICYQGLNSSLEIYDGKCYYNDYLGVRIKSEGYTYSESTSDDYDLVVINGYVDANLKNITNSPYKINQVIISNNMQKDYSNTISPEEYNQALDTAYSIRDDQVE